ncbi:choline transport protein (amino acid permease) [Paraphaeosphaeria sporulosa]
MKDEAPIHIENASGSGSAEGSLEGAVPLAGVLRPRLSKLNMVGFSFAILNTWICLAATIGIVMPSGGSVAFIYGFVFCTLCNIAITASLGEMASIWPTAGGQYHFTYSLSSQKWKVITSFCCGWANIAGWLTLVTTEAFFAAQFLSAAAVIGSGGSYVIEPWKTYLIMVAVSTYGTLVNLFGNSILGRYNDCALYWSVGGCAVISVVLLACTGSHNDFTGAEFVFTSFANETGYSDGVSWILGLLQSALSLIGYDVVLHMTEEMPTPRIDAPLAMIMAVVVGGVTGTGFILVMLFCLFDPSSVFSSQTGQPITQLMYLVTRSRVGTVIMSVMLSICFFNGTMGCMTSASRLLYAMARDKGMIFPSFFGRIHRRLDVPIECIIFVQVFNLIFGLLYLGPTVAFNAYISSCTILLNLSYVIPITVIVARGRSVLTQYQTDETPFKLGKWGWLCNIVSVIYVFVTNVFFCFPAAIPVNTNNMNYVSAVIGVFVILLGAYYIFYGKQFTGPKFEAILETVEHERELHRNSIDRNMDHVIHGRRNSLDPSEPRHVTEIEEKNVVTS